MGKGASNKRKGSNAERHYAKVFRDLGYQHCETARFGSKKHDNAKVDLIFIPFNVQVKAGIQQNMNAGKELFSMENCVKTMFPLDHEVQTKPKLLFHYKQGKRGKKRVADDELVYMSEQQFNIFKESLKDLDKNDFNYMSKKSFKFELESEFKDVVCMTFEYFKEKVIKNLYKC